MQNLWWLLVGLAVIEIILQIYKYHLKKEHRIEYEQSANKKNNESYIRYYKRKQLLDVYHILIVFGLIAYATIVKNPSIFSGLVIALGALVIAFQTFFVSILMYFWLIANYKAGDTVRIGEYQGEIIAIKLLHMQLIGRDDDGEHSGELIEIPNVQARLQPIIKKDLKRTSMRKMIFEYSIDKKQIEISVEKIRNSLKEQIDPIFEENTIKRAKHYKTYIGYKYKRAVDVVGQEIVFRIYFLATIEEAQNYKLSLIEIFQKTLHKKIKHKKQVG